MTMKHPGVFFSPAILARVGVPQWWKCMKKLWFFDHFHERNRPRVNFRHLIRRLTCSIQREESNISFRTIQGAKWTPGEFSSFSSKVKSWWCSCSWWIKWEFPWFTFSIAKCLKMLSFIDSGSPPPASMARLKNTPGWNHRIHRDLIQDIKKFSIFRYVCT